MGSQIGVTGLAVMGQNLARNIARHGFPVAVHNRTESRTKQLIEHHGDEGDFTPAYSLEEFVAALDRPRRIIIMVKAGAPVDAVIKDLIPLLDAGDIIIDGGNSHYEDTRRRVAELTEHDLHFVGAGISGGEEGALNGPSIMPGGPREAYDPVEPILTAIAAQVDDTPCCAYIGPDGAGHYVKMAHNGIEYADMQLIAEAYDLLTHAAGLSAPEIARVFEQWNEGDLESFLIEITAKVLAHTDAATGKPLVDVILDQAEQKGTGRWTAQSALELGVPVTAITEAVFARALSARKDERTKASKILPGPAAGEAEAGFVDAVRDALYASKVVAYAQGFEQIRAASNEYGWNVEPGTLATIWRGGCIIRARFLNRIKDAYDRDPELSNLLLDDYFRDAVAGAQDAWRKVVRTAVELGVPTPAFSSALAYYDGFRREQGPASLIQGLRDYFGAHTYRRLDREGVFHTLWSEDGREVSAD
ncbi:NADP-dependent phosphogluconate dehydrogenase [Actinoallomurus purpureus]|uniref:NADP-dependent phosphogluconate dehydrogenase n=1 Tax=Actinoallomurus purpureus TaxID=478114 RepID=UPI00209295A1|nr:NADP-dependent phosphogluconate dehydrogenase [Actinoallomurus purpureus]MCO6009691.1 NADP-dependent phosphogluconate dehydrogenase [Actinoallomurus purpureus]